MKRNRFTYDSLNHEYHTLDLSLAAIAQKHGVSSQTVFRAINRLGIKLKSKSEAHRAAIKSERFVHPLKGKERSDVDKKKISDGMKKYWHNKQTTSKEEGNEDSRGIT